MRKQWLLCLVVLAGVPACTWVKPTEGGAKVAVMDAAQVENCRKLGTTTTGVKHRVAGVERNREKVREELMTLGRNEAATMGGDTLVPLGPVVDGGMKFAVYRCQP